MKNNSYDVIIVGAGLGGLTCGNYLTLNKKRVLILEKNPFPGGCCSSFIKEGYRLDVGPHFFLKKPLVTTLKDLGLYLPYDFWHHMPSLQLKLKYKNKWIMLNNFQEIQSLLQRWFPKERISHFFNLLSKKNSDFFRLSSSSVTFKELLDNYFTEPFLKILFCRFADYMATSVDCLCPMTAMQSLASIYGNEGLYSKKGVQYVPELLTKNYLENNGQLILRRRVTNIKFSKNFGYSVRTHFNERFYTKNLVCNISPMRLLKYLESPLRPSSMLLQKIKKGTLSDSLFILHIALNKKHPFLCSKQRVVFLDMDEALNQAQQSHNIGSYLKPTNLLSFVGRHSIPKNRRHNYSLNILVKSSYQTPKFWFRYRQKMANDIIATVDSIYPHFSRNIKFRDITTPPMLEALTGNERGSIAGWALTGEQSFLRRFPNSGLLKQLYFVGHWAAPGWGIHNALMSGKMVAKKILCSQS